ncbi:hypothetical protein HYQ46_007990 [Verticillium longisporum]|nr:hypothetical protein HYQ46_007990 [Verticillium longisporum]
MGTTYLCLYSPPISTFQTTFFRACNNDASLSCYQPGVPPSTEHLFFDSGSWSEEASEVSPPALRLTSRSLAASPLPGY